MTNAVHGRRKLDQVLQDEITMIQQRMHELELFITKGLSEATGLTKVLESKLQGIEEAVKSLKSTLITINLFFIGGLVTAVLAAILK
jgi:hypothetical protein